MESFPEWIIANKEQPELKGVRIHSIESFNDGDVCISFITHEILQNAETPICIDIGADVGWWSAFCLAYNNQAFVYTFEPNPISFQKLSQTLLDERVKLYNMAVSNTDSTLLFHLDGPTTHSRDENLEGVVEIPCRSIRYILEKHSRVELLKIDTEGHEPEILLDLKPCWNKVGTILFEFTVRWYTKRVAIELLEEIIDSFPYVYGLSRRVEYERCGPITRDNYLEFVHFLYRANIQIDIVASRETIKGLPSRPVPLSA